MKHLTFIPKPPVALGVALALSCPIVYAAPHATYSGNTLVIPHLIYNKAMYEITFKFKAPDIFVLQPEKKLAAMPSAPAVDVSEELKFNLGEVNVGGTLYRADFAPAVKGEKVPAVGMEFKASFIMPSFINKLFIGDKITGYGVLDDHGFVGCTWGGYSSPDGKNLVGYDCGDEYGRPVSLDAQNARLVVHNKLAGSEATWPRAVNNTGDVAGTAKINTTPDNKEHPVEVVNAYFSKAGADPINIGTLGAGKASEATGINNKGVVVGYSTTKVDGKRDGGHTAFMYDSATKKLSALSGTGIGDLSKANGINDAGQIVGSTTASDGTVSGFVYQDGQAKLLGSFDDSGYSEASAINDKGWTTGFSDDAEGNSVAFIHDGSKMTKIPGLTGDSKGTGINTHGHVIGSYTDSIDGSDRFFLYKDGKVTDLLDALSDADKGKWKAIFAVHSIADDGTIAGDGTYFVDKPSKRWVWQAFKLKL